jgi:hypothetical protein
MNMKVVVTMNPEDIIGGLDTPNEGIALIKSICHQFCMVDFDLTVIKQLAIELVSELDVPEIKGYSEIVSKLKELIEAMEKQND